MFFRIPRLTPGYIRFLQESRDASTPAEDCVRWVNVASRLANMEVIVRLFPYGKAFAGIRQVCDQAHLVKDSTQARPRRKVPGPQPWSPSSSSAVIEPSGGAGGGGGDDPCSLLQTQAAQTVLQTQEGSVMPRVAVLLGLMGIGMSGYSSRQLALHYKPSGHLFR